MEEILTLDEVAALLKVKPRTIYEMVSARGQARSKHPIPFTKFNAKCLRFRRADIEEWIRTTFREGSCPTS